MGLSGSIQHVDGSMLDRLGSGRLVPEAAEAARLRAILRGRRRGGDVQAVRCLFRRMLLLLPPQHVRCTGHCTNDDCACTLP